MTSGLDWSDIAIASFMMSVLSLLTHAIYEAVIYLRCPLVLQPNVPDCSYDDEWEEQEQNKPQLVPGHSPRSGYSDVELADIKQNPNASGKPVLKTPVESFSK
jgi:hypothetical protein